jgi:TolA-binding protein
VQRASKRKKQQDPVAIAAPAPAVPAPAPVVEAPIAPRPDAPVIVRGPEARHPRATRTHAPAQVQHEPPAALETKAPVVTVKPAATKPAETLAPAESAELALFRRAMKLHSAKDRAAVAAWDDFLRVAPKSALATEARYNRALCLVRLGRADDARKALAPFARGDIDGYRQREAAELIEALDERDAGVRER